MVDAKRVATATGVAAPVIGYGAILLSTVLSPSFSWTGTALSHMGMVDQPTAPLFNGGLILAGVVGAPFLWRLWGDAVTLAHRVGVGAFGLALVAMVGIGTFPWPQALHMPSALGHYVFFTIGLLSYGSGDVLAGRARQGLAAMWLAAIHLLGWILWTVYLYVNELTGLPGFAVVEFFGAALFGGWLIAMAVRRLSVEDPTPSGTPSAGD